MRSLHFYDRFEMKTRRWYRILALNEKREGTDTNTDRLMLLLSRTFNNECNLFCRPALPTSLSGAGRKSIDSENSNTPQLYSIVLYVLSILFIKLILQITRFGYSDDSFSLIHSGTIRTLNESIATT